MNRWEQAPIEPVEFGPDAEFAPTTDIPTEGETFFRAAIPFSDELSGAAGAAKDFLTGAETPGTYSQYRDEARERARIGGQEHPWTQAAGGVAGALIPAWGLAKGASRIIKAPWALPAAGAAEGAITGYDVSEAPDVPTQIVHSLRGAALGGVLGSVLPLGARAYDTYGAFRSDLLNRFVPRRKNTGIPDDVPAPRAVREPSPERAAEAPAPTAANTGLPADIPTPTVGGTPIHSPLSTTLWETPKATVYPGARPTKAEILRLIATGGEASSDPALARFLQAEGRPAAERVRAPFDVEFSRVKPKPVLDPTTGEVIDPGLTRAMTAHLGIRKYAEGKRAPHPETITAWEPALRREGIAEEGKDAYRAFRADMVTRLRPGSGRGEVEYRWTPKREALEMGAGKAGLPKARQSFLDQQRSAEARRMRREAMENSQ